MKTPILDRIEFGMNNGTILIVILIVLGVIIYFGVKFIAKVIKHHYYKQFYTEQRRVEQYKRIKVRKLRTYQKTINNFFYNRIAEDVYNYNNPLSSSAKKVINLYKGEIKNDR